MKVLLLSLFILFGSLAQAWDPYDNKVVNRFRKAAIEAIEEAQGRGFNIVNGIDFSDLKTKMKSAVIVFYPHVTLKMASRRCAMWTNDLTVIPSIFLNEECDSIPYEELKALALHESLGYAYSADREYEISAQVFSGKAAQSDGWLIDFTQVQKNKLMYIASTDRGGATGVGGGGDSADLVFKKAGLAAIDETPGDDIDGIPKELLRFSMNHMRVRPAADMDVLIQMRGSGVENGGKPVVYVQSKYYRDPNGTYHRELALLAARSYLLYGSDDLGLTSQRPTSFRYELVSRAIKKPCMAFASFGDIPFIWKNPDLLNKYSPQEAKEICDFAFKRAFQRQSREQKDEKALSGAVLVRLNENL